MSRPNIRKSWSEYLCSSSTRDLRPAKKFYRSASTLFDGTMDALVLRAMQFVGLPRTRIRKSTPNRPTQRAECRVPNNPYFPAESGMMPSSGHMCRGLVLHGMKHVQEMLWRDGTESREMVPNSAGRDWIENELVSGVCAISGAV
jgi:hypothetical protein